MSPTDDRLRLTISTTSSLRSNAAVELTIKGVAREAIDGGEVVLALPTRAIMDHALDTGVPEVPAKARWDLPAIVKGGTWSETYTVPGEAAGYYNVMVNAYTHGPDGGPWLFDDVSRSAWMFVDETDGQLTRYFEDSLFPDSIHPVPGPRRRIGGRSATGGSRPDSTKTSWHPDSVFVGVQYYNSWRDGFKHAVAMELYAYEYREDRRVRRNPQSTIVPEDGIVAFGCPPEGWYLEGKGNLPETRYVVGRSWVIPYWWAGRSDCGRLKIVDVEPDWYVPWRHLNIGGERISKHFWHYRENPVDWSVNFDKSYTSRYNPITDKITLRASFTREDQALYVASHEYGHALHHKALGGLWWTGDRSWDFWDWGCFSHQLDDDISVRCALLEGFAQYAGVIGSDGYRRECFEHFGDPTKPVRDSIPGWRLCRKEAPHGQKPKIEGHVAALFLDLTDADNERGDWTTYSGVYIAMVFKTCKVKNRYWVGWTLLTGNIYIYKWWKRINVSNIVWCLERQVDIPVHEEVFPYIKTPRDVTTRGAERYEPEDWNLADIRVTWQNNLKSY
ncbi:MAG: hypothetical protein J4F34_09245 [Gemmatimonadetes bacterium]|nr:hypothetical protein [Gemmatimonadota bacterium]